MNVKVVLDGHSTNDSEMQHNGMEGIKFVGSQARSIYQYKSLRSKILLMNVKVVLDGHSTNDSEMQHNGMEGIKKKTNTCGLSFGEFFLAGNFPHHIICYLLPILRCGIHIVFVYIEMNINSQINNMYYLWATATCFGYLSVSIIRLC